MKKKLLALLLGTTLVLAACGGGNDTATEKEESSGGTNETTTANAGNADELYKNKCSSCHGANLEGGVGPDLTKVGSSLSPQVIEDIIVKGKGSMPGGLLKGEEATQVAEWLAEHK